MRRSDTLKVNLDEYDLKQMSAALVSLSKIFATTGITFHGTLRIANDNADGEFDIWFNGAVEQYVMEVRQ